MCSAGLPVLALLAQASLSAAASAGVIGAGRCVTFFCPRPLKDDGIIRRATTGGASGVIKDSITGDTQAAFLNVASNVSCC